mmetsp:Transcript_27027/g.54402  ORF Transcript_27027/g.54402 Transcript_27027/m.54402 type:complete len:269 (-) Transcript_27027:70-876(-)
MIRAKTHMQDNRHKQQRAKEMCLRMIRASEVQRLKRQWSASIWRLRWLSGTVSLVFPLRRAQQCRPFQVNASFVACEECGGLKRASFAGGRNAMETAVMSSIQADNFKFVRHMIMAGGTYSTPNQCIFSVTINRLGADRQVKEDWHVSNANPLHYAISCGSLNAAVALLIAFPELISEKCAVRIEAEGRKAKRARWTPLSLASFFAQLYLCVDAPRHEGYSRAAAVLERLSTDPQGFPFVHHDTPRERLEASGSDMDVVLTAFAAATG